VRRLGLVALAQFRANPMFVERDATYSNDKPDPGAAFMTGSRARGNASRIYRSPESRESRGI